jgi:hypothetical protein
VKLSAALLALSLTAPIGLSTTAATPAQAQADTMQLSPAQATKVSQQLLEVLRQRQASVLHQTLTDSVRSSITIEQVQKRLDQRTAISNSRVVGVSPGYRTTTVDAVVTTATGEETLLIVLDDDGKLLAWKWTDQVQAIETTALAFVKDLADGKWLMARSQLSLDLQQDLPPTDLQRKWTKIANVSGGFRKIKDAVIASQGGNQQLVLVAVEFGKATSNLFVIFDDRGRIINVDISRDFV